MANGVNKWIGVGNLCADPQLRQTTNGTPVCNLRIACNERRKKNGETVDQVEFVSVVVWGELAQSCARYLATGRTIYVEGRLQTRKWSGKDGGDRYTTEVVADRIVFMPNGSKDKEPGGEKPEHLNTDDMPF